MKSTVLPKLPTIQKIVNIDKVRKYVEKLSIKQILQELNDSDVEIIDNRIFKIMKINDKIPVTLLAYYVDCPWSIYVAKELAKKYSFEKTLLFPIDVRGVLFGKIIHEKYLNYLEQEFGFPIEVKIEHTFQVNGRSIKVIGKVDALIPSNDHIIVLEFLCKYGHTYTFQITTLVKKLQNR